MPPHAKRLSPPISARSAPRALVVGVALTVTLVGCSGNTTDIDNPGGVTLGDSVVALRISAQLSDMGYGRDKGYVALIDSDGESRFVRTDAMDNGKLSWTEGSLSFGDVSHEYLLSDSGLETVERGSDEAFEDLRVDVSPEAGFVTVHNSGWSDRGYREQVTRVAEGDLETWSTLGLYTTIAVCDRRNVFAITDTSDTLPPDSEEVAGDPREQKLVRVFPRSSMASDQAVDTVLVPADVEAPGGSGVCEDDTVYGIEYNFGDERPDLPSGALLRSWNTGNGDHRFTALVDEAGERAPLGPDDASPMDGIIVDSDYYWSTSYSDVYRTRLSTGTTTRIVHPTLASPESGLSEVLLSPQAAYVLDVPQEADAVHTLTRYDLHDGTRTEVLRISGLESVLDDSSMVIRDLALDPEFLADLDS